MDNWGLAPGSIRRNGLKLVSGGWEEHQPDGLVWHFDEDGIATKIVSASDATWTITRNEDCFVSSIAGPKGRTTSISGNGGTFVVTQPGSKITTFTVSGDELTAVDYPAGTSLSLGYSSEHLLQSLTIGGHTIAITFDSRRRVKTLNFSGSLYELNYIDGSYGSYGGSDQIVVTDPEGASTTISHDCNVVKVVEQPIVGKTTYSWSAGDDPKLD